MCAKYQQFLAIKSNYIMITCMASVPAKLVAIGNSRGVRLPKAMIEQAGLGADIELEVIDGAIVIRSHRPVRAGWAEATRKAIDMAAALTAATFFFRPSSHADTSSRMV